jgi:hypothetical protein
MKIDEKRLIQNTKGLNGEVEKKEDLRNEKTRRAMVCQHTVTGDRPYRSPRRHLLEAFQYLASAIDGFAIVLLYLLSARGRFENSNQKTQEGRENRASQPSR